MQNCSLNSNPNIPQHTTTTNVRKDDRMYCQLLNMKMTCLYYCDALSSPWRVVASLRVRRGRSGSACSAPTTLLCSGWRPATARLGPPAPARRRGELVRGGCWVFLRWSGSPWRAARCRSVVGSVNVHTGCIDPFTRPRDVDAFYPIDTSSVPRTSRTGASHAPRGRSTGAPSSSRRAQIGGNFVRAPMSAYGFRAQRSSASMYRGPGRLVEDLVLGCCYLGHPWRLQGPGLCAIGH